MNGNCDTCDMEKLCGYQYKPCDCCNYRKFLGVPPARPAAPARDGCAGEAGNTAINGDGAVSEMLCSTAAKG